MNLVMTCRFFCKNYSCGLGTSFFAGFISHPHCVTVSLNMFYPTLRDPDDYLSKRDKIPFVFLQLYYSIVSKIKKDLGFLTCLTSKELAYASVYNDETLALHLVCT